MALRPITNKPGGVYRFDPLKPGKKAFREGLRVQLSRVPGITQKGILANGPFTFQCPPLEEFAVDYAHSHSDYETVDEGQFSRKGGVQLRTVSFDSLFVDWGTFTVTKTYIHIEDLTARLIKLAESGSPFLLTVAHDLPPYGFANWDLTLAGPELQMLATLRTLRVAEKAGEGDTRYVNVAFTEYRDPVVERHRFGKKKSAGNRPGGRDWPVTGRISLREGWFVWHPDDDDPILTRLERSGYEDFGERTLLLVKGPQDLVHYPIWKYRPVTLARLARYFYGKPEYAQHIARANKLSWGSDTPIWRLPKYSRRSLKQGAKLVIPRPPPKKKKGPKAKPKPKPRPR